MPPPNPYLLYGGLEHIGTVMYRQGTYEKKKYWIETWRRYAPLVTDEEDGRGAYRYMECCTMERLGTDFLEVRVTLKQTPLFAPKC
jgi:hypothetical protein